MPTGPQGQKRPPDLIANAILVAKIATGEVKDPIRLVPAKTEQEIAIQKAKRKVLAQVAGRLGGLKGGKARDKALGTKEKRAIAKKAANARWKKKKG